MSFPLYSIFYGAAALLASPYYLARGLKQDKYLWNLKTRMGIDLVSPEAGQGPRVWVHAMSLGEVVSSTELVRELKEQGYKVCISTTTRSGAEIAEKNLPDFFRFSLPFDLPLFVDRVITAIKPDVFVLVETDIWPNLLAGLSKADTPAVLVGGRISPRSLAGYKLIRSFWSRVLNRFEHICCQSSLDLKRFLALGANEDIMSITGNLKFDRKDIESGPEAAKKILEQAGLPDGPWIVCGSTHPGEEDIILDIFRRLKTENPGWRLIIAPRNKSRFEAVWRLIQQTGLPAARRSKGIPHAAPDIFLLDTLGELDAFYEIGDIVFVGKSLPTPGEGGGHNLLEPAVRAKPVLFGPRMHNFPEISRLIAEAKGGIMVADVRQLEAAFRNLISDPELRIKMGLRALAAIEPHKGAVARTVKVIEAVLAKRQVN